MQMRVILLPLLLSATTFSIAATIEITPADNFEASAAALNPGDELVLGGGTYLFDENITVSVNGTAAQPITIRARDGEQPILQQATANHNALEINSSAYLVFRGIEVTGGSHGIRLINSDYITIEDCEIHETGDVALSANSGGTYDGLRLLRNHIHHTNGTGEGMYLGCNNDACRISNSLIEGNYIHHTNRATVSQGDGIEIKEGSFGNTVRNNVIHDTLYPGILLYSTVGNGAQNIVEGNVIWNVSDNTMQVAADAIIRNNIILGNVAFQAHQSGSPSNIEFVHNTVINSGNILSVRNITGPVLIANNAVYSQSLAINLISGNINQVTLAGNVGTGGIAGASNGYTEGAGIATDFVQANYSGNPPIDLYPGPASALVGAADTRFLTTDDFNGTSRADGDVAGAYHYVAGGNPGWVLSEGFKNVAAPTARTPNAPTDLRAN